MNRIMLIMVVAVLAISTACQAPPEKEGSEIPADSGAADGVEATEEAEEVNDSGFKGEFLELVESGAHAGELGIFIRENISLVSESEAEEMIEALVIEQQGMIEKVNGRIYRPEYLDALNMDMKGVLDSELVSEIENSEVRSDYQNLVDGYLTIVRYEETPSVETDWEAIYGLKEYFSDDFSEMTRLFDKIQSYRYDRMEPDFKAIYDDAVRTEELIEDNDESFLTWQLDTLYKRQVGSLLIGPEGSYIGAFVSKSGEPYDSLIASAKVYPDAWLSGLVRRLDENENADFKEIVDMVELFDAFGLKSPAKALQTREDGGDVLEGLAYVSIEGDMPAEKKINDTINETALRLKDALGIKNDISYRSRIMFANGNYLSTIITASGTDDEGSFEYEESRNVLDMKTGERITITDFFGMPWDELEDELQKLTGKEIESAPDFYLIWMGLAVNIAKEDGEYYDYVVITFDDLIKYVPVEAFYK